MKRIYQRSQILHFCELDSLQQSQAIDLTDPETAEHDRYVLWNNEPLPLSMFIRCDGLFHGNFGLSYYSAYLIRINRTQEFATVVYAHW